MKVYSTADLRNVALVGHGGAGKTSLVSALLFVAGAVNRLGRVDDGSAVTDYDEEEIERKISLQTAIAHLEWKGRRINLVDTPGYAAFVSDAKPAVAVADAALRRRRGPGRGPGHHRARVGLRRAVRGAGCVRGEQARSRERVVRARGGRDPGALRAYRRADPAADREGARLRRRGRPARRARLPLRQRPLGEDDRGGGATGAWPTRSRPRAQR